MNSRWLHPKLDHLGVQLPPQVLVARILGEVHEVEVVHVACAASVGRIASQSVVDAMSSDNKKNHKVKRAGKLGKVDRGGANLGRSIIRQQFPTAQPTAQPGALETERGKGKLRSVTQCDDLEEFMSLAAVLKDFWLSVVKLPKD